MTAGIRDERFCVIADDLTGAMDTGVGLAHAGLSAIITFSPSMDISSDAVVVTTDSRAESATEAYRRAKAAAERFRDYFVYKKVDSTLRGNVAAELQALLDVTGASHGVVCPAFPAIKRTVVNGHLLVDGIPVNQTSFSRDPVSPVVYSDIVELLRVGSGITARKLSLEDVEMGPGHLAVKILESECRVVVVDAVEEQHLRCIADAVALSTERLLPCGSGGLGAHIPPAFGYEVRERDLPPPPKGPVLLVVGSRNDVSVRQLQRVLDTLHPPLVRVEPSEFRSKAGRGPRANQLAARIIELFSQDRVVVLSSSLSDYAPQLRHTMAPVLGAIVTRVLAGSPVAGLFLSGGDVARAVCGENGIQALQILGDLQPGVIVGAAVGARYQGLRVITKAGGFGNEDAMTQAIQHFTQGA
ncbi:MAG: four-carbon acid sugar kinase family protein [Dehalococcoidia bacterium]|nr:four-carbon acid sugar kinase family protein [Dehalococcoidia bacterium]